MPSTLITAYLITAYKGTSDTAVCDRSRLHPVWDASSSLGCVIPEYNGLKKTTLFTLVQQFPPSSEMAADKTRRPALKISGRMDASLQSNALMKLACSPL
ncbi:hypothetical protein, partial [Halochromatium glycolicum]|uniref:hypothetical protein n=1 Tax=Halochromatium glycolicum TaxID=85075 RepID=UPI001A93932B